MSLSIFTAKAVRPPKLLIAQHDARSWKRGLAFICGFCIEFNVTAGIGAAEASANGLYGYRLIDFVAFASVGLLGFYSLVPRRILSLAVYGIVVLALFSLPALSADPRTTVLAYRYMLYSLAALYIVVVINEATDWFCWGLIIGLLANAPIFAIQSSEYSSELVDWGLIPRYAGVVFWGDGGLLRYSGLYGHPNEAGHVAALAAAAGAYFAVARRKFLPAAIVSAGLLAVFYYARSRAGLFSGGVILGVSILIAQARVTLFRSAVIMAAVIISVAVLSQVDFVASRFGDDPLVSHNISERFSSTWSGIGVSLAHPFGMSIDEFASSIASESGGFVTPHNGFIFFGGVFGLLPLMVLLLVCTASLRPHNDAGVFFAFLTAQIALSFLFEQLSVSPSYILAVCIVGAEAFVRTGIGSAFLERSGAIAERTRF